MRLEFAINIKCVLFSVCCLSVNAIISFRRIRFGSFSFESDSNDKPIQHTRNVCSAQAVQSTFLTFLMSNVDGMTITMLLPHSEHVFDPHSTNF